MVWDSSAAQIYHQRWFEQHLPSDISEIIEPLVKKLMGFTIAEPLSRDVLSKLAVTPPDNAKFAFMDSQNIDVAGCPSRFNRIRYS